MDSIFKLALVLSAVDHLTGPLRNATLQMETLNGVAKRAQAVKELGGDITIAGATMSFGASKMMGMMNALLQPALEGEAALARVASITSRSVDQIDKAATAWSLIHVGGDTDFMAAAQPMMKAGLTIQQVIEGTKQAMALATVTGGEYVQTSKLIAAVYDTMGDKTRDVGSEMARLGDILKATKDTFEIGDLDSFSKTFALASKAAIPLRIPLAQVTTVLGALSRAGLQGRPAGAGFTAMMLNMDIAARKLHFSVARTADGQMDMIGTLGNIQKKFGAIDELTPRMRTRFESAFGQGGAVTLSMLLNEAGAAQELARSVGGIENPAVRVAAALKQIEGTGQGQVKVIAQNWERVQEILGNFLLPVLKEVQPYVVEAVAGFQRFSEAHPTLLKTGMVISAIVAPVLAVAGAFITVSGTIAIFGGSALTMFTKAAAWIIAQTAAMTVQTDIYGVSLVTTSKTSVGAFVSSLGKLASMAATSVVGALKAATMATWGFTTALLANPIVAVIAAITALAVGVYLIIRNWQWLADRYEEIWASVKAAFQGFGGWVSGWIGQCVGYVSALWSQVQSLFGGGLSGILKMLLTFSPVGILTLALGEVGKLLRETNWFNEGAALIQGLVDGIKARASAAWAIVGEIAGGIKDRFKALMGISSPSRVFVDFGTNVVAGLARGVQLAEGMASSRVAQLARTVTAAAAIAVSPTIAMATTAAPSVLAAMPSARSASDAPGGGVVHIDYHPVTHIPSDVSPATAQKFEDLLRQHERRILQIVQDGMKKAERRKY